MTKAAEDVAVVILAGLLAALAFGTDLGLVGVMGAGAGTLTALLLLWLYRTRAH